MEDQLSALAQMSAGWHLLTPFPVQPQQLDIICNVIETMRQGYMDYITVELLEFQGGIDFIQTTTAEPGYRVEIKLTQQDTKMYACYVDTAREVCDLFCSVLTEDSLPDLTGWEDITRRVFNLGPDWESDMQEDMPEWQKKLQ